MTWLNDNWIWIAVAIGAFLLMTRMGGMGCGMAGMGHRRNGDGSTDGDINPNSAQPGAIDPVSRHPVAPAHAVMGAYHGRIYSFESRENRETFDREPEKYLADDNVIGQTAGNSNAAAHRHHGCY